MQYLDAIIELLGQVRDTQAAVIAQAAAKVAEAMAIICRTRHGGYVSMSASAAGTGSSPNMRKNGQIPKAKWNMASSGV